MIRKTTGLEAGRWVGVLPAALLGGLAVQYTMLKLNAWLFGINQLYWPGSLAAILPYCAVPAAVLTAAWVAPRAKLTAALSVFLLLGSLGTLINVITFYASEAKVIFAPPLIAVYFGGGLACLLVWATQRRRPS